MAAHYIGVEEARSLTGLRLVTTAHVPGLWSEAAKALFDVKNIDYVLVEQVVGGANDALREWTGQTSGPVAIWNDERPRSTWNEQLYLAERLSPTPALIPDSSDRPIMFGLCNELAGENGFGWNLRLRVVHQGLTNESVPPEAKHLSQILASKYGYDPALIDGARRQQIMIVSHLRDRLAEQRSAGRRFLIGTTLTALDIYWAVFAGAIDPLPPELCPGMPEPMRQAYSDAELKAIAGETLLAHRDEIYRDYLKLPMNF